KDGCTYRLPTEAEHAYLRRGPAAPQVVGFDADPTLAIDSAEFLHAKLANTALAMGSECSVSWSRPGLFGVHDVAGNVWN
ncbi:SUMF1/EgtB/PvdO family nonheme iron enzyme, partial [Escherichia coli]|uniref:SUMF1/EgtB/PvdO family nonheme iron enzyme n=1 Tax=Escherichia coli TaxID=562 RepID=UPI000CC55391